MSYGHDPWVAPDTGAVVSGPDGHEPREPREARRRIRLDTNPETAQKDLAALVLTVVELLRQLMERQALRRVEDGTLTDAKIEEIGRTLMALDARMSEITDHFELTRDDLNIDLGPLGPLLPQD